jgi:hypothetical protein
MLNSDNYQRSRIGSWNKKKCMPKIFIIYPAASQNTLSSDSSWKAENLSRIERPGMVESSRLSLKIRTVLYEILERVLPMLFHIKREQIQFSDKMFMIIQPTYKYSKKRIESKRTFCYRGYIVFNTRFTTEGDSSILCYAVKVKGHKHAI